MLNIIIGCGSVGSYIAKGLLNEIKDGVGLNNNFCFIDGDTVERKNLKNQWFNLNHLGKKKAIALQNTAQKHFKCNAISYPLYIDEFVNIDLFLKPVLTEHKEVTIYSCVDGDARETTAPYVEDICMAIIANNKKVNLIETRSMEGSLRVLGITSGDKEHLHEYFSVGCKHPNNVVDDAGCNAVSVSGSYTSKSYEAITYAVCNAASKTFICHYGFIGSSPLRINTKACRTANGWEA